MDPTAQHLRSRASGMRLLSGRLDAAPILGLEAAAGSDTWQCPVADEYRFQLGRFQQRVLQAAEDLRWEAWLLDQRAAEIDAVAAALAPLGSAG